MDEKNLFTITTFLLTLKMPEKVDAIVVFPGMGEEDRVTQAVELFNVGAANALVVAGVNEPYKKEYGLLTVERLQRLGVMHIENVYTEGESLHTRDQSLWSAGMLKQIKAESVLLIASPFHIVRAYLTFLKACFDSGLKVKVYPCFQSVSPFTSLLGGKSGWDLARGEATKIIEYCAKGDVLQFEEYKEYLEWLWSVPN